MSYEAWRVSYQSSEHAAKAAWEESERLRTELGRAYRALNAYTSARDRGEPLPDHAVAYHSLTEAAAKRFVNHGALDGSEYFIGKSVDVLHAALRGDDEPIAG